MANNANIFHSHNYTKNKRMVGMNFMTYEMEEREATWHTGNRTMRTLGMYRMSLREAQGMAKWEGNEHGRKKET